MAEFNPKTPRWVTPAFAAERINNAWLLQWAGKGYLQSLIERGTQGVHSHSAMFRRNADSTIDVLELIHSGGACKPFDWYVDQASGRIDVFSPNAGGRWPEFDAAKCVATMRTLTCYQYSYFGLLGMALRRTPLIWRLFPQGDEYPDAAHPEARQYFCSHACAMSYQYGGGVDVVPRCPNYKVAPAMLTTSMFFEYQFSIATPWACRNYKADILELAKANEREMEVMQK